MKRLTFALIGLFPLCCLAQPQALFSPVSSPVVYSPDGLDENHWEALGQIATDLGNLHNMANTRSHSAMENYPRINIEGDWSLTCLANLFTLIQNQGINRTYFNRGAAATLDRMNTLLDIITAPFSTIKRFLTSQAVQQAIKKALSADEPQDAFIENIKELLEENGEAFPEGAEGDKLEAKLRDLYELRELSLQNSSLPDDSKWEYWTFDPGNSSLDDLGEVFGVENSDPLIPSTAMIRFGTVDDEDNPLEDPEGDEGSMAYKVVVKGVANQAYPANASCEGQIEEYDVEITNYGHFEDGKFVSDYIEYDIYLDCCNEDDDGDVSYEGYESEPIAYLPGQDYSLLAGGLVGLGLSDDSYSVCLGGMAQYYPDMSIGSCGSRPAIGLNAILDRYDTFGEEYENKGFDVNVVPQVLLFSPVSDRLSTIAGVSVPVSFGRFRYGDPTLELFSDRRRTFGAGLTCGLAYELENFQLQAQTDILSFTHVAQEPIDYPGNGYTNNFFNLGLNKSNAVKVLAGFRF